MVYAGTNYRDKIIELIEEGLLTEREALNECLCYMSMDDNRRCYNFMLGYLGVEDNTDDEEPIVPMFTENL